MSEFHFLRPFLLWLLFLPLGALLWTWAQGGLQNPWKTLCDPLLLKALQRQSISKLHWLFYLLIAVTWAGIMLAAAGPSWNRQPRPAFQMKSAGVIVVDLSTHMLAEDLKPNRLSRAKFKCRDLLSEMKETAVGMIAFAKEPYVVSPVTTDAETIQTLLPELSPSIMPVQGSELGLALKKAAELLKNSGNLHGFILLITASPVKSEDKKMARSLAKQGIHLIVLGVATKLGAPIPGTSEFSRLDSEGLHALASAGQGTLIDFSQDNHDIEMIMQSLPSEKHLQKTDQVSSEWWDYGRFLLWILLPLIALLYRKGWFEEVVS